MQKVPEHAVCSAIKSSTSDAAAAAAAAPCQEDNSASDKWKLAVF